MQKLKWQDSFDIATFAQNTLSIISTTVTILVLSSQLNQSGN